MGDKLEGRAGWNALASELKRLRGARTLREVAALSRAPSLADQVVPLTATQIAQLERGAATPSVEALHALATVYRVSPQRFFEALSSGRHQDGVELPETGDETEAAYNAALRESRWQDAIALALHGESLAGLPVERVVWRARRGTCLPYVGRHDEAILILTECLNSPHVGKHRKFQLLRNLADVHVIAGYLESAVECARKSVQCIPDGTATATRVSVVAGLVSALLGKQGLGEAADPQELEEVHRLIEQVRGTPGTEDPHWSLFLELCRGIALEMQGRLGEAAKVLKGVARRASDAREERLKMLAMLNLGILRHRQGRLPECEQHLLHALTLALSLKQVNETFEIYLELLLLARETGSPYQSHYFQRCQHYYPLVSARTPSVQRFEQLERGVGA